MAATGREPAGERDIYIWDNITGAKGKADQPVSIDNAITCPHPMGQVPGSGEPQIPNTITKPGPNR